MSNNTKQVPSTTFAEWRWKQYVPRKVGTHPDEDRRGVITDDNTHAAP